MNYHSHFRRQSRIFSVRDILRRVWMGVRVRCMQPCYYHKRLTIPQDGYLVGIPMNNGDFSGNFVQTKCSDLKFSMTLPRCWTCDPTSQFIELQFRCQDISESFRPITTIERELFCFSLRRCRTSVQDATAAALAGRRGTTNATCWRGSLRITRDAEHRTRPVRPTVRSKPSL